METNRIPIKKLALGVGAVLAISIVIMLTIGVAVTDNTSAQASLSDGNICLAGMSNTDLRTLLTWLLSRMLLIELL